MFLCSFYDVYINAFVVVLSCLGLGQHGLDYISNTVSLYHSFSYSRLQDRPIILFEWKTFFIGASLL